VERIRKQSEETDLSYINESIIKLSQTLSDAKWSTQPRILLELCIVKLAMDQTGFSSIPVQGYVKTTEPQPAVKVVKTTESKQTETITSESKPVEPRAAVMQNTADHDRLWHMIFEEGETLKGSFNLLRVGTKLKEINENHFIVEASNEMTLAYVRENAFDLESLMEKHVGKRLLLECSLTDGSGRQEQEKTAEDLASEIGNKFGIHIDIQ